MAYPALGGVEPNQKPSPNAADGGLATASTEIEGGLKKAAGPALEEYGKAQLPEDSAKQFGDAWIKNNYDFNNKEVKQGLTQTIDGIMDAMGSSMVGGSGAGLLEKAGPEATGIKALFQRMTPMAARALAGAVAGGYVSGPAARVIAKGLGMDPDSQDLVAAMGTFAGGAVGGHLAAGGLHPGDWFHRNEHPAEASPSGEGEHVRPEYRAVPELDANDFEEPEEKEPQPVKPEVQRPGTKEALPEDESGTALHRSAVRKNLAGRGDLTEEEQSLLDRQEARAAQVRSLPPEEAAKLNQRDYAQWQSQRDPYGKPDDWAEERKASELKGDKAAADRLDEHFGPVADEREVRDRFPDATEDQVQEKLEEAKKTSAEWDSARQGFTKWKEQQEAEETESAKAETTKPKAETTLAKAETEAAKTGPLQETPQEPVGAVDEESGRVVTQPTDSLATAQKLATAAAPELKSKLEGITGNVEGAAVAGVRDEKDRDRALEKSKQQDQPVETISDLLAARVSVDSPAGKDAVVAELRKQFPIVKEENQFAKGDPEFGFRNHTLQVGMGNGSTAEVQVLPKPIADIAEQTHGNYVKAREAEAAGDTETVKALQAKNRELHDAAMEKFNAVKSESKGVDGATEQPGASAVSTDKAGAPASIKIDTAGNGLGGTEPTSIAIKDKTGEPVEMRRRFARKYDLIADGKNVGDISYSPYPDGTWAVGGVHVEPAYQRRGIASAAYDAIEKVLGKPLHQSGSGTAAGRDFWVARNAKKKVREADNKSALAKGQHVALPDGRSAKVGYHDTKFSGKVRVTTEDGTHMEVPRKDLTPVRVQPLKPTEPWYGFDLDKTLFKFDKFKGSLDIGAPIDGPGTAMEALKEHLAAGHNVRILTARVSGKNDPYGKIARTIQARLQNYIGQAVPVTSEKDNFMQLLYDDRAVAVEPNTGKIIGGTEHVEDHGTSSIQGNEEALPAAPASSPAAADLQRAGGSGSGNATAANAAKPADDASTAPANAAAAAPAKQEAKEPVHAAAPVEEQPRDARGRFNVTNIPVQVMKTGDLSLDPKRFQFKLNKDSATGASDIERNWNPLLADALDVWRDPENGKTYVVEGHHRYGIAKRGKVPELNVRLIPPELAKTAEEARSIGALLNIGRGHGTAIDAAKYFRESKMTPEHLADEGISLSEGVASQGLALSRLSDRLFDDLVAGKMKIGRGVVIGEATADPAQQDAIMKLIQRREQSGKSVPNELVQEMAELAKGAGEHTASQVNLFGLQEMTKNHALEKADASLAIAKRISEERRLFSTAGDENKAAKLGEKGNTIKAEENAKVAEDAAQAAELFKFLKSRAGETNDVLTRAADELSRGGNKADILRRAYDDVRTALQTALTRGEAPRADGIQEADFASRPRRPKGFKGALPEDQPLPGLERALEEQRASAEHEQGKQLAEELAKPKGDISKKASDMERNSPLFRNSEANDQGSLFSKRLQVGEHQLNPGGRNPLFDWWKARSETEGMTIDQVEDYINKQVKDLDYPWKIDYKSLRDDVTKAIAKGWDSVSGASDDPRLVAMRAEIEENAEQASHRIQYAMRDSGDENALVVDAHGVALLRKVGRISWNQDFNGMVISPELFEAAYGALLKAANTLINQGKVKAGRNILRLMDRLAGAQAESGYIPIVVEPSAPGVWAEEMLHGWQIRHGMHDDDAVVGFLANHPFAKELAKNLEELGYRAYQPVQLAMETLAKAITGEFEEEHGVARDKVAAFVSDALQFIGARMGEHVLADIPTRSADTVAKLLQEHADYGLRDQAEGTGPSGTRGETDGGQGRQGEGGQQLKLKFPGDPDFLSIVKRVQNWAVDKETVGERQAAIQRQTRGEMDREIARVVELLKPARRAWDLRSHQDTTTFINAIETGQIHTLAPKDQPLANYLHGMYAPLIRELRAAKPGVLQNLIQNYFARWWKNPGAAQRIVNAVLSGKRPFAGRASFLLQRSVPLFTDGLAMGLEPQSWNPVDISLHKYAEMGQFLMAHKTLNQMKADGIAQFVRILGKRPDGYTRLDDRIGTVMSRDAQGQMIIRGHYWAPDDAARVFNNYLSRGLSAHNGAVLGTHLGQAYDALSWVNNNMNALQLGLSAFHFTFTALLAPVSDFTLGLRQISEGKPFRGVGNMAMALTTFPSIARAAVNGHMLLKEYVSPGTYKAMAAAANAMEVSGGRAQMRPLDVKPWRKLMQHIRNGEIPSALSTIPGTILQSVVGPIMDHWVPWMKLGAVYQMQADTLAEGVKRGWSHERIRTQLDKDWDSGDNRYGQVVYDNKFWHRIIADVLHIGMRSVGWNHGSVAEQGGGAHDVLQEGAKLLTSGEMPKLTNRSAFLFGMPIYFGVMGAIATYIWQHREPQDWKDLFHPMTPSGTRISPPSYMKDDSGIAHDPVGTVLNKQSPILEAIGETLRNRDFYNQEIVHTDDPLVKELASFAGWAVGVNSPFSFQGIQKLLQAEGEDATWDWKHPEQSTMRIAAAIGRHPLDLTLGNLGFQASPGYIQNSKALNMAREYNRVNRPPGTKTSGQAEYDRAKYAAEDIFRQQPADKAQALVEKLYVDTGKMTRAEMFKARYLAHRDPLPASVEGLSPEQALNVYVAASDQERKSIRNIVAEKTSLDGVDKDHRLSAEQKQEVHTSAQHVLYGR